MVEGIKCPHCGSEDVAEALYGMPAFTEELQRKLEAGDVVLEGCDIPMGCKFYPYVCKQCGHRFDDEMAAVPSAKAYFNAEDYAWIESIAALMDETDDDAIYELFFDDESLAVCCTCLARSLLDDDPLAFESQLEYDEGATYRSFGNPTFARLSLLGLEYGVACGDGACVNYLGAMYYMGNVVEQDYARAKELYELAESKGIERAMLNLGYIYEYGRCGKPDHQKAFMQYAKVAALTGHTEALYKMGDMYSRAKVVEQDLRAAYRLYESSLKAAGSDVVLLAQPAIRLAKLVADPNNHSWDIPYDPMRALALYQLAERGLRIDIAHGQTYYKERLQEAIEGQERMREVLDEPGIVL